MSGRARQGSGTGRVVTGGNGVRVVSQEAGPAASPPAQRRRRWPSWLVLAAYLIAAVAVTWRLWADPASRAQAGDVSDVDQFTWFLRYSATAVSHLHLPALFTHAMNAPHGVNLTSNTAFLLPGVILTPVTLLAGPQVSLTVALTAGFAGSAASLFWVLRRWDASVSAAALGGALYGFSPALLNSGIGHYQLQFAVLPPLIADALLRLVTGRARPVRGGAWLGVLLAAQLFTGAELLVDTIVGCAVLLAVLAVSARHELAERARAALPGLAAAVLTAGVLTGRAIWVQLSGPAVHASPNSLNVYFTRPYSLVTAPGEVIFHTAHSAAIASGYPETQAEYLAYLGWLLLAVLLAAAIWLWRDPRIRLLAIIVLVLEIFSLGGAGVEAAGLHYPGVLLPWHWLQDLPVLDSALPNRLVIVADAAAGALLAFALDQARRQAPAAGRWRHGGAIATAVAVLAVLSIAPLPYQAVRVAPLPAGWTATFARLDLPPGARTLIAPVPYSYLSAPMRWQADSGEPRSMVGGTFIAVDSAGVTRRSGLAGRTVLADYIDDLWVGTPVVPQPPMPLLHADLRVLGPAAVVAVTGPRSALGRFLARLLGPPDHHIGSVLSWRLTR
jgi:hypothetical protein